MPTNLQNINGIFILDKPHGLSSNFALQQIKRLFKAKKAGHTGSLDVLATGLLPIVLGEAAKFSQFLLDADKHYQVTACLGKRTTTLDAEGDVTEEKSFDHVTAEQLKKVLQQFTGAIQQVPPMYSALKRQGQTLYKLARQGVEIKREPRPVTIHQLTLLEWQGELLTLDVHCSKGTYIRTLVDDIGQALNSCAYVNNLRRLGAGPYHATQMHTVEALEAMTEGQRLESLLPIDSMLEGYPMLSLDDQQVERLYHGLQLTAYKVAAEVCGSTKISEKVGVQSFNLFRLYHKSNFLGMGELTSDNSLKVKRLLNKTS